MNTLGKSLIALSFVLCFTYLAQFGASATHAMSIKSYFLYACFPVFLMGIYLYMRGTRQMKSQA